MNREVSASAPDWNQGTNLTAGVDDFDLEVLGIGPLEAVAEHVVWSARSDDAAESLALIDNSTKRL